MKYNTIPCRIGRAPKNDGYNTLDLFSYESIVNMPSNCMVWQSMIMAWRGNGNGNWYGMVWQQ